MLIQISCGSTDNKTDENTEKNADVKVEKNTDEKAAKNKPKEKRIKLVRKDAENKVEVYIDNALFTAYIYPESIQKPVLFPLNTS